VVVSAVQTPASLTSTRAEVQDKLPPYQLAAPIDVPSTPVRDTAVDQ
jgi:hypothetical protein